MTCAITHLALHLAHALRRGSRVPGPQHIGDCGMDQQRSPELLRQCALEHSKYGAGLTRSANCLLQPSSTPAPKFVDFNMPIREFGGWNAQEYARTGGPE
jgi:hypothetical protein